ncbi:MAG: hypothetical protein OXD45_14100 [Rhodobacteraceae bacterium]|nr:hypothetical protein [Paracoccaceae bacterium]
MSNRPFSNHDTGVSKGGRKTYQVHLEEELLHLLHLVDCRKDSAESRRQAYILLLADEGNRDGGFKDGDIAGVGIVTPERMRRQCVMEGLDAPLNRREQANRKKRILDGEGETRLVRLACSKPPSGRSEWTIQISRDWRSSQAYPWKRCGGH